MNTDDTTKKHQIIQKMQYCLASDPCDGKALTFCILDNIKQKSQDNLRITSNIYFQDTCPLDIGNHIEINFLQSFQCTLCHKKVKKLFNGFCYVCFTKKAAADLCVLNPHKCHYAQGTCREPQWGLDFCFQPHFVYLAYTDKFKVGITRESQLPYRWFDQGATRAALLARVASRYEAGVIEHTLSEHVSHRTHWQNMIKKANEGPTDEEFRACFEKLVEIPLPVPESFYKHLTIVELSYPIMSIPHKIKSLSLDKENRIAGKIIGIKGQYICFEDTVFNVRNHEGYEVDCKVW
jgi:hypothetical protein